MIRSPRESSRLANLVHVLIERFPTVKSSMTTRGTNGASKSPNLDSKAISRTVVAQSNPSPHMKHNPRAQAWFPNP